MDIVKKTPPGSPLDDPITLCFYLWLSVTVLIEPDTPVVEKVYT